MYQLLIVDDEPLIRRGIKALVDFPSLDISSVLEARNGEEAVQLVEVHHPDFILLDINMPKMDGLSVARAVKQLDQHIQIALVTGYDYFDYAQTAIKIGVQDYLLKPVDKHDIVAVLKKMIDRKRELGIIKQLTALSGNEEAMLSSHPAVSDYIEAHIYDSQLSLNHVARAIGYNASHLSTVVKQIYGMPFQDYVNERRMARAKILLISSQMKNYQISEAIGYENVNYFSTKFKKAFGITPKQYRSQVVTGDDN